MVLVIAIIILSRLAPISIEFRLHFLILSSKHKSISLNWKQKNLFFCGPKIIDKFWNAVVIAGEIRIKEDVIYLVILLLILSPIKISWFLYEYYAFDMHFLVCH